LFSSFTEKSFMETLKVTTSSGCTLFSGDNQDCLLATSHHVRNAISHIHYACVEPE